MYVKEKFVIDYRMCIGTNIYYLTKIYYELTMKIVKGKSIINVDNSNYFI